MIPQQQVLLDGVAIVTYVDEANDGSNNVVVEARGIGPMVVDRSRVEPLV